MNEFKVRKEHRLFFINIRFGNVFFSGLFSLKKIVIFPAVLLSLFFISTIQAIAQSEADSGYKYQTDDSVSTDTEDYYDTTGYYFNPKEYAGEAYAKEKTAVRVSSDTTMQRLKKDDDFWYVKSIEDFKKNASRLRYDKPYRDSLTKEGLLPPDEQVFTQEPDSNSWYLQPWFSNLIWMVIIAIFVGAVVYFLLSNKINVFSRSVAKRSEEAMASEEDLFSINYESLLAKYTAEKNYRLAVRVLYLQLIKILSEKKMIVYQPQFTNTQYLQQIAGSPLYTGFFTVTHHYEYVWYGGFLITESSFQKIAADFANIQKQVASR